MGKKNYINCNYRIFPVEVVILQDLTTFFNSPPDFIPIRVNCPGIFINEWEHIKGLFNIEFLGINFVTNDFLENLWAKSYKLLGFDTQ